MKHPKLKVWIAALLALALLTLSTGLADEMAVPEINEEALAEVVEEASVSLDAAEEETLTLDQSDLAALAEASDAETAAEASAEAAAESTSARNSDAYSSTIRLGVGEKHTLTVQDVLGSDYSLTTSLYDWYDAEEITFKSSNKKVATVTAKGVVKPLKKGTAVIRYRLDSTLIAAIKVKVVAAPTKVTMVKKITLGKGETVQLTPKIPSSSHASFTWSSAKKAIAAVSAAGVVKGKKVGTTVITVKTHNGKKAKVQVTVCKAPGKVTLNKSTLTLKQGKSAKLKATLPNNSYSRLTWSSSNEDVATVASNGKVTAVAAGRAVITVQTYNGKQAQCSVLVKTSSSPSDADDTVTYRALLIGEEAFNPRCTRNRGDVRLMANMLSSISGLYGGSYSITRAYDLGDEEVISAIGTTFADADENDVSLFFIATHGDTATSGSSAGALSMVDGSWLYMSTLANALQDVPGKVIVILESCGSGAAVYDESASNALRANAIAFDQAAIRAFAAADTGITVELEANELDSSGIRTNTGELRVENKFYVLTASRYQEESYGYENTSELDSYNLFTLWLTNGVGTSGSMPADDNSDSMLTLNELYSYISEVGDNTALFVSGEAYYQHVQVYPANSSYVLFTR